MTLRVLVTGSRDWEDEDALRLTFFNWWIAAGQPQNPTLVSGACPRGADAMAEGLFHWLGYPIESHPADWDGLGKKAGFVRNAEMVNLGASHCLAFIRNGSKGASHTVALAQKAGIPVTIVRQDDK